ncbi:iron ABC transporter permease [Actinospica sp. MGRD01-02]|uniref:Iron ABC transporter permease n=1 Tax=Actinospica acidithermotolerans TaxID=2828514 RepID=A0A941E644_9ACTN|nr:iron ABC transporter permease [Actinospica acidithermotolerans]MBR7827045.1 iron ABC transporter permease [Actinospica acidithermotolerans]
MLPARARPVSVVLVVALLGALIAVPVGQLARTAFASGWSGAMAAAGSRQAVLALEHTALVSVLVTAFAVICGGALALVVERRPRRSRTLLRLAVISPLLIPEFVLGFSWSQAYGPSGTLDRAAGITVPGLLGPTGVVLVLTVHAIPLAYLVIAAGLATRAEPDLELAARASGANGRTVLRTVTLPLLRPALTAAAALVFVTSTNSFAVPQVLGEPAGFATMSTLIFNDLNLSASPDVFNQLAVVALEQTALVLAAILVFGLILRRTATESVRGPTTVGERAAVAAGGHVASRITTALVGLYVLIATVVPLLVLIGVALTRGPGLAPTPANWTTSNFADAFSGPTWVGLWHSLVLAALAAVIVIVMCLPTVLGTGGRARTTLGAGVLLGYAVPGSALAVGILIAYGSPLEGSAMIILIAYLAKLWAVGHRPLSAGVDRLVPEHAMAARASGAGPLTALGSVVLPPLRVALLTGAGLVFVLAVQEVTMSGILYGPGSETFAAVILNQQDLGSDGATAALALTMTVPLLFIGLLLVAGRRRLRSPEAVA